MIVVYGYRSFFKREGSVGREICKNCGHEVMQTLCRQMNEGTLFWIPLIKVEKQRGIMCESCGNIRPLNKQEYKDRRKYIQSMNQQ